jgi:(p)ppGpp synthase/HD superfamily hydrolase
MGSGYSSRYNLALGLAARAHASQRRKGSDVPYIAHPVHVARILERHGYGEELVLAALLHDTLEDTALTEEEIATAMGAEIVALVRAVTERKTDERGERPWEIRKRESLDRLAKEGAADLRVVALKTADALHNVNETLEHVRRAGPTAAFAVFKRGPAQSLAYYRGVLAIAGERLGRAPIVVELGEVLEALSIAAGVTGGDLGITERAG